MKIPKSITMTVDLDEEHQKQLYEIMMQLESVVSKKKKTIYKTIFLSGLVVVATNMKNYLENENGQKRKKGN